MMGCTALSNSRGLKRDLDLATGVAVDRAHAGVDQLHQIAHQRESDASALLAAGQLALAAEERLEHALELRLENAGAEVAHAHQERVAGALAADLEPGRAVALAVLERVVEHVEEHLLERIDI